jgi:hypothetical protein
MAIAYAEALIDARLDEITTRAGNAALLRIYSGTRPATGGTATTLLAELTCGSPFAGSASGGELTANTISDDTSANATGTATWFRVVQSDGSTHVMDGDVAASGSDLNLNSTSIVSGGTVSVTSFVITGGNA